MQSLFRLTQSRSESLRESKLEEKSTAMNTGNVSMRRTEPCVLQFDRHGCAFKSATTSPCATACWLRWMNKECALGLEKAGYPTLVGSKRKKWWHHNHACLVRLSIRCGHESGIVFIGVHGGLHLFYFRFTKLLFLMLSQQFWALVWTSDRLFLGRIDWLIDYWMCDSQLILWCLQKKNVHCWHRFIWTGARIGHGWHLVTEVVLSGRYSLCNIRSETLSGKALDLFACGECGCWSMLLEGLGFFCSPCGCRVCKNLSMKGRGSERVQETNERNMPDSCSLSWLEPW